MFNLIKTLFFKIPNSDNSSIILDKFKFNEIKRQNRGVLKQYDKWLSMEDWRNSYYGYGVPDNIFNLLDQDIGDEMTYTDLIAYYSRLVKGINYLEVGVSVGKNFMQLANSFKESCLTGFDIENINPTILQRLSYVSGIQWETIDYSLRKEPSYLNSYGYNTNIVRYLAGDIWDEVSWKNLEGNKFNLIFSDALHDPKALLWEYEMITKYDLLDQEFIFFWDDLNNGLEKSFKIISEHLIERKKVTKANIHLIKVNGWIGENESVLHDVGIISTFPLK